jgi:hypothetical protein
MANFCIECGRELSPDWNVCPDCGTKVFKVPAKVSYSQSDPSMAQKYPPPLSIKQEKTTIEIVNQYIWILSLIAGIMGLLAILAPAGVYQYTYFGMVVESWNMWMFGYNVLYDYSAGYLTFWTDMPVPYSLSIITTIIIVITSIMIIGFSIRLKNKEVKSSGLILGAGIILIITAVAYIIVFHIYTSSFSGYSIWTLMFPGFGLIGQFISGVLIIIGYIVAKRYNF